MSSISKSNRYANSGIYKYQKLKFDSVEPFIVIFLFYINLMIIIRFKNLIKLNLI